MEHIVYSEIWTDPMIDEESYFLRLAIPAHRVCSGSLPSEEKSFLVKLSGIGLVQFDFLGFIKGKSIYQSSSIDQPDPAKLPLTVVKLVAEHQLTYRATGGNNRA